MDIIDRKNKSEVAIQCKMYAGKIGNKAVQEIHAGKSFYNSKHGVVVSNSTYSKSARQLGKSLGVHLLHHSQLINLEKEILIPKGNNT